MNGLEGEYAGRVVFAYYDVDDPANDSLFSAYSTGYIPVTVLLDGDGNLAGQWTGVTSAGTLRAAINAVLTP